MGGEELRAQCSGLRGRKQGTRSSERSAQGSGEEWLNNFRSLPVNLSYHEFL